MTTFITKSAALLTIMAMLSFSVVPAAQAEEVAPSTPAVEEVTVPEVAEPESIAGCTDDAAENYSSDATIDDGSCVYAEEEPVTEETEETELNLEKFMPKDKGESCPAPEVELVKIEMCKFNAASSSAPLAGWGVTLTNGDGLWYDLVTGDDGCVSYDVDPAVGPWEAIEEDREGWEQDYVSVGNGITYINQPENAYACRFFEQSTTTESAAAAVASTTDEISYRCDFFNQPIVTTPEVPQCKDEPNGGWADSVLDPEQGLRKDGSAVDMARSSTSTILGAADWSEGDTDGFYSLGFEGAVIVGFDSYVPDVAGNDITVYEATNGEYPEEAAAIWVSQDMEDWYFVGFATNPGASSFDVASTSLSWIQYVGIVDVTDPEIHSADADGFDLDAVRATQTVCDKPKDDNTDPEVEVDTYRIKGYVWHDDNTNQAWDGVQSEEPLESPLAGWVVRITNGSTTLSTTTDATGFYYFEVPAGTWTITEEVEEGWERTTQESHVVTVPEVAELTMLETVFDLIVPTAEAAVLGVYGDYNFGNNETDTPSTGGRGGRGSRSSATKTLGAPTPTPMVLGEQTSVVPQGAPGAGHGGSQTQNFSGFIPMVGATRRLTVK